MQALQRGDGRLEIALGVVEALNVPTDLEHHPLGVLCFRFNAVDFGVQLVDRRLRLVDVPLRFLACLGLRLDGAGDLFVKRRDLRLEPRDERVEVLEARLARELLIDVLDSIKIRGVQRIVRLLIDVIHRGAVAAITKQK